jgi:hypothetical protein
MGSEFIVLDKKENVTKTNDFEKGNILSDYSCYSDELNSRDEIINLYIEKLDFLPPLTNAESKVLIYAIKNLNYSNTFFFSNSFLSYFIDNKILSRASVYNSIKSLIEKKILTKATEELKREFGLYGNDIYSINSSVIGKGPFSDLKELKKTIIKTFDFEKMEMRQETFFTTTYNELFNVPEDLNDISKSKIVTENFSTEKNVDKTFETKIESAEHKKMNLELEKENLKLQLRLLEAENIKLDKEIELIKLKNSNV